MKVRPGLSAFVFAASGDADEVPPAEIRTPEGSENEGGSSGAVAGADGPVDEGSPGDMLTPASVASTAGPSTVAVAGSRDSRTAGKYCI